MSKPEFHFGITYIYIHIYRTHTYKYIGVYKRDLPRAEIRALHKLRDAIRFLITVVIIAAIVHPPSINYGRTRFGENDNDIISLDVSGSVRAVRNSK